MSRSLIGSLVFLLILGAVAAQAAGPASQTAVPMVADFATGPLVFTTADGCTASLTCPSGAYLYCSSPVPGTCTAASNYVECNGQRTYCPACTAEKECCDGSWVYCEGNVCSQLFRGVRCDGIAYLCPRCPPLP